MEMSMPIPNFLLDLLKAAHNYNPIVNLISKIECQIPEGSHHSITWNLAFFYYDGNKRIPGLCHVFDTISSPTCILWILPNIGSSR